MSAMWGGNSEREKVGINELVPFLVFIYDRRREGREIEEYPEKKGRREK